MYDSKDSNNHSIDPMPFMRCIFCGWPVFSGGSDSIGVFSVSLWSLSGSSFALLLFVVQYV